MRYKGGACNRHAGISLNAADKWSTILDSVAAHDGSIEVSVFSNIRYAETALSSRLSKWYADKYRHFANVA